MDVGRLLSSESLFELYTLNTPYYAPVVALVAVAAAYMYIRHPAWSCPRSACPDAAADARLPRRMVSLAWLITACEVLTGFPIALNRTVCLAVALVSNRTAVFMADCMMIGEPPYYAARTPVERLLGGASQLLLAAIAVSAVLAARAWARRRLSSNGPAPRYLALLFLAFVVLWGLVAGFPLDFGDLAFWLGLVVLPLCLLADGLARIFATKPARLT
jgi:hypothetical protein